MSKLSPSDLTSASDLNLRPRRWTSADVASLKSGHSFVAPNIGPADAVFQDPSLGIWDAWPATRLDGSLFQTAEGARLWFALAAPHLADPDERHVHARIHLFCERAGRWEGLGPAMPDGFSPGSREWSGSAVVHDDDITLTLFFTAAGYRNEPNVRFAQRLFQATATLSPQGGKILLADWRDLCESITRDPEIYMDPEAGKGAVGTIKAFRDPGYFRDPATNSAYLLFTGSLARSESPFNGVIGIAAGAHDRMDRWMIQPPIITAEGVNNELERPHIVVHDGLYYLFWSTQASVFNPVGPVGPTGLYGMVSRDLSGGWLPLNGSGLVIANPSSAPRQAYSWLVLPDLTVTSFVDNPGYGPDGGDSKQFVGAFAPWLALDIYGASAQLRPLA